MESSYICSSESHSFGYIIIVTSASQKQLNLKHVNSVAHSNRNTKPSECLRSQHADALLFVDYLHLYLISTGIVDLIIENPEYEYSHQWSLQVEGLSVLKKQHDVSFQVTQAAVTMAPNPLLQQQT